MFQAQNSKQDGQSPCPHRACILVQEANYTHKQIDWIGVSQPQPCNTLDHTVLCCWGWSYASSDLYPLDASINPTPPSCDYQKCLRILPHVPLGGKIALSWESPDLRKINLTIFKLCSLHFWEGDEQPNSWHRWGEEDQRRCWLCNVFVTSVVDGHVWFGVPYHSLPYSWYQFFINLDYWFRSFSEQGRRNVSTKRHNNHFTKLEFEVTAWPLLGSSEKKNERE